MTTPTKLPFWKDRRIWSIVLVLALGVACLILMIVFRHQLYTSRTREATPEMQLMQEQTTLIPNPSNTPFQPVSNTPTPSPIPPMKTSVYKMIAIDDEDVGTFQNTGDNSLLTAQCIDPKLPTPEVGTLYILNARNILFPQDPMQIGILQRFEVR